MKIAIYGMGLIGGSIGKSALKKTAHTVYGADINPENIVKAKLVGAIHAELSLQTLAECDLVILAIYPQSACAVMREILPLLKDGATVIDCCGTKRLIVGEMADCTKKYPNLNFVGVHPMAGKEFSGISHASANLFENSFTIITPVTQDIKILALVRDFFFELGSTNIQVATADQHDKLISYTSQLAHVLSSCYVKNPLCSSYAGFSAGSFRDMTRVARLNAEMWTGLCLENADNLAEQIQNLIDNLQQYKSAIENKDALTLARLFDEGTKLKIRADEALRERRKQ